MPRRAYLADVESVKGTELPNGIAEFKSGDDDGTFVFQYVGFGTEPISLQAMIPEVSDYPDEHSWFVYSTSDHVPASVNKILDAADFAGLRIHPMLCKLATTLSQSVSEAAASDEDTDVDFQEDFDSDDEVMTDAFGDEAFDELRSQDSEDELTMHSLEDPDRTAFGPAVLTDEQQQLQKRIRSDLKFARKAGFRVSGAGPIFDGGLDCFIILACRISRLGIQEDTLQAWHLDPRKYLLLILRYPEGYKPLDQSLMRNGANLVQLKIVLANKFKLPYPQAVRMFVKTKNQGERHNVGSTKIEALFIDRPLNELLNQRLLTLLRYRQELGLGWRGSEDYYNDAQGKQVDSGHFVADKYYTVSDKAPPHLPSLATADHLGGKETPRSLPLAAMQFALRHLVRCTEFCLVCHSHVGNSFEALKPYVCSKPLCLYQYMSLGFGPSIESEIVSQPDVVDLLICFCYHAAGGFALDGPNKLPVGMGLTVPPYHDRLLTIPVASSQPSNSHDKPDTGSLHVHKAQFDEAQSELIVEEGTSLAVHAGQWIYITGQIPGLGVCNQHRRVLEVWGNHLVLGPIVYANPREREAPVPVLSKRTNSVLSERDAKRGKTKEVRFLGWSSEFDTLDAADQQRAIISLLNTLPSIEEMKNYVIEAGNKDGALSEWKDRISPAALGLLRWIIASNRSCIVMVDSLDHNEPREAGVVGLPQKYVQFRFAQGAPDKEQRFVEAVNDARKRLKSNFPTIFAWHGSPLSNWHSIIREGLHYKMVRHGRAYGDGIYHALDINVSTGYSRGVAGRGINYHGTALAAYWPSSRLHLESAICLNEIVNAPDEFQSRNPYLVVQHVDWVQTRYLFIGTTLQDASIRRKEPEVFLEQHSALRPTAAPGAVQLPISAIPRSRAALVKTAKNHSGSRLAIIDLTRGSDEDDSEESSAEDQALYKDSIRAAPAAQKEFKPQANRHSDFHPGALDASNLPMIAAPSYATSQATKALQRELKKTLDVLDKEGTFSLGWYLDRELVTNMYQWIFELHSFEASLPLAKDLKSKKATAVVLEVRFGPNYPYAPPFVRIIKPRFLPFLQGGGGHVTAGGAMCMELLTNSGWNPATAIEALILQVRMALTSTDPQPARLEKGPEVREYGIAEAAAAFRRASELHGWKVPPDLDAITRQSL